MGGGGGLNILNQFQTRKSSDFQQYDPRPLFKIKYDPHTLSQTKSMTPPPPPSVIFVNLKKYKRPLFLLPYWAHKRVTDNFRTVLRLTVFRWAPPPPPPHVRMERH